MVDGNGLPGRVRQLEEEAAVCRDRWGNQLGPAGVNKMTDRRITKMERDQNRVLAWGAALFALAGVASSFIRDAIAAALG